MMHIEKTIRELVARSCLALDSNDWRSFLDLCDSAFVYRIKAYSPEIRRDMLWMEKDKAGLNELFDTLPRHNMDRTPLTRHISLYTVEVDPSGSTARALSTLQVYRTESDGGVTSLVAVGKYLDRIALNGATPKLLEREVRLDTRMLGLGYHVPF